MTKPMITLLLIEDNPVDALLIKEIIDQVNARNTVWKLIQVDRLDRGLEVLREHVDAILLDLNLPDSRGYDTFAAVQKAAPAIPIIMFTAMDDEAMAVQAVSAGAQDYLIKGQVHHLILARSIHYAIERKRMERERERLIKDLQEALAHVKTLSGLLPICANCKKIRDDQGYWHQVDRFIAQHTDVNFSHGICPECAHKMYPGLFPDKEKV